MYNLCLLKIGDINITVSSLHPLRSIQQDLTQDVKQPDAIKYIHEVSNKIFFLNDTSDFIRQKLFLWQSYDQGFAPKFPENHNTSKNDLSIDRLHSPQQKSARKFISNQYCISFFKVIIIASRVKVPTCHTITGSH